jgi:hypothetical protein
MTDGGWKRDLSESLVEESFSILKDFDEAILSNRNCVLSDCDCHDDIDVLFSLVQYNKIPSISLTQVGGDWLL